MPDVIAGFPVQEIQFKKDGTILDPTAAQALHQMIDDRHLTDLLVMSHGWNNNLDEARGLYTAWLGDLANAPTTATWSAKRTLGAFAVLWPSKKFEIPDEIAGGSAALGDDTAQLVDHIAQLEGIGSDDVVAKL